MIKITIDGRELEVKEGITVIEAIDQAKIGLPRYCYHPGLSIAGNCRICQVEIEKMPKPMIACNTIVQAGMVIHTQSEKAKGAQQDVLQFLLVNHPLDCPVCDQAGECKLQDYYMQYGRYEPVFDENKVKKTKKAHAVGPTIMLDQERCVLCSRCVRFGDEITKTHDFGIFNRGDRAEVDVYPGHELNNKYSGNVADICPVGALTDRDFRFKIRVWYLASGDSICTGCSRGCNIHMEFDKSRPYRPKNGERVMRFRPRENKDVNQWWMCDEGRYSYKAIDQNRLVGVRMKGRGIAVVDWEEAYSQVVLDLERSKQHSQKWALLASPQSTNEDLFLIRKIFVDSLGWQNLGFATELENGESDKFLIQADKNPNSSGALKILDLKQTSIQPLVNDAQNGKFEGLVVFERDLAMFSQETLAEIRKKVRTLIFIGSHENRTARMADIVLPASSFAETAGTFTNFKGRVQRIQAVLDPLAESLPLWKILKGIATRLGLKMNYNQPSEVFQALALENAAFKGMTYEKIGASGATWKEKAHAGTHSH